MIEKTKLKLNFEVKNFSFLNEVKLPFASKGFKNKVAKFEDFNFVKTASKEIDVKTDDGGDLKYPTNFNIKEEMQSHPDNLFIKALAIIADVPNDNGDYFSKEELLKSYHTFVGCPLFCNHKNDDVEEARGTILYAEWDDSVNGIMIIGRVDTKAYPKLARGISEGYILGVSMGCQVERSACSICDNEAIKEEDYCEHIRNHKTKTYKGEPVFERNSGIKFIELSFVVDPACDICFIEEIFDVDDIVAKVAEVTTSLKKIAQTVTKGGKVEIEKLNQAENLMQDVAKTMLDQKEYIQLEYVSDLVEALSKLQETKDELVDMGYENVPSNTPLDGEAPITPETGEGNFPAEENYDNISTAPAGDVGSVTMPGQFASKDNDKVVVGSDKSLKKYISNKLTNIWDKE
jgi:hypothetical protein